VLRQSEQLRDLSNRLLQAQDQERRHIARELHDSAGQIVTVMGIYLARIGQEAKRNSSPVLKDVEECQQLAQQLNKEIRTTSYLLYPPLLDEMGLQEALRWYIQGLKDRTGLEIKLNVSEGFGRLPRDMELIVYRLVQECLTNIHRHSGSKTAAIDFVRDGDRFSLEIQDAGSGIPQEKLKLLQLQGGGVGIRGMRERIRQFGGRMDIHSSDGGTTISFSFQLPNNIPPSSGNIEQQVQASS
jgi:signal transduction histidine kinase